MTSKQRGGTVRRQAVPDHGLRDASSAELDARRLGWALVPLRLFLGLTFVYGGIQKLSDPGFLHPGAPTYIGTQLRGFAHATPGGFLLRAFAIPHPALSGVGVALVEIAVGLLVCAGLLTRAAAAVGLTLNLLLFLTNSWHTYPYFLGSDIVFVFAWMPFVVVGAARQPTLEAALRRFTASRAGATVRPSIRSSAPRGRTRRAGVADEELTRRSVIGAALGVVAAATAALAGLSVLLRGSYRPPRSLTASRTRAAAGKAQNAGGAARTSTSAGLPPPPSARGVPARAVKLGAASQLPAGAGATYADPGDGQPDIVIRQSNGTLVAYSAVCPHAGCTVEYGGGQIVCPCHGSTFNAQTGAVTNGPATTGLAPRKVLQRGGEIYAVPV
jgi:thiosulfate dehydrogenase (quinone) large subunit